MDRTDLIRDGFADLTDDELLEFDPDDLSFEQRELFFVEITKRLSNPDNNLTEEHRLGFMAALGIMLPIERNVYNSHLDHLIEEIAGRYRGQDITAVPSDERDLLVNYYEFRHPENARKMNDFLATIERCGGHDDAIRDIKYLSYASLDPYHTVYFKYLPQIAIKEHHQDGIQYFQVGACGANNIYVDLGQVFDLDSSSNPSPNCRGGYTVFFHEIGHAIDWILGLPSTALDDAITNDVRNALKGYIESRYPLPHTQENQDDIGAILDSLMANAPPMPSTGDVARDSFATLNRNNTIAYFRRNVLNGGANDTASDVFGGVTDNRVAGFWGHWPEDGVSYWVDKGHKPSSELFANAFSRHMTGYRDAIQSIDDNFLTAHEQFENLIRNAAQ